MADDSYQLDPEWQKQVVYYRTTEAPGTIIIYTAERHLYLVQPGGRALRYGIGVGRDGFQWQGLLSITRKQEWPDWTPPPEMIARQPYLPRFMAGGPGNPLGARALYLGTTVYRIHGTNQPQTIGTEVSSGCFRLVNADVADLYDRVPVGTKVIVRQKPRTVIAAAASLHTFSFRSYCKGQIMRYISEPAWLIGLAVAVARRGRRHHLRALRHPHAETHRPPRRGAVRRQHRACPASPSPTTKATGPASTSISAARLRPRSSTIRTR